MAGSMPGYSHPPLGSNLTIVAEIPAMNGIKPPASPRTPFPSRSIASHQTYENQWDNWTVNKSLPETPASHTSTIATNATCYSEPLPNDGTAKVFRVNAAKIFESWTWVPIASSSMMSHAREHQ